MNPATESPVSTGHAPETPPPDPAIKDFPHGSCQESFGWPVFLFAAIFLLGAGVIAGFPEWLTHAPAENMAVSEQSATLPPITEPDQVALPSVADMMGGLQARLEQNPDDAAGWRLLAQSFEHIGDASQASMAHAQADALEGRLPTTGFKR